MKREEFEKLAEPVFSRLFVALQKHKVELDMAGIKLANIELVGGGTRIPAFIRMVQGLFKMDPSRTINSSEAVAKGCAIMAAWKNPAFRPADMTLEEANYNPIVAYWHIGRSISFSGNLNNVNTHNFPEANRNQLLPLGCPSPTAKELVINNASGNVDLYLAYDPPINGFEAGIAFCQIERVPANSNVVLSIALDENGLVNIVKAEAQHHGTSTKLDPKIHQHVNLASEHIRLLMNAELKMEEQDKSTEQVYELKNKL